MNQHPSRTAAASWYGALVPAACAVHCLAAPLLVSLLPALGAESTERWLMAATALAGAGILARGVWRHRRPWPLALFAVGVTLWTLPAADALADLPEHLTVVTGHLCVAAALLGNAWSARHCRAPASHRPG